MVVLFGGFGYSIRAVKTGTISAACSSTLGILDNFRAIARIAFLTVKAFPIA